MATRRKNCTQSACHKRLQMEMLESRRLLAAYPAYVDGAFTFGDATASAPYGLANTFELESLPGADKTIYLDFDGHLSAGNSWQHNIDFPAFNVSGSSATFTDSELIQIQQSWQNVAEDYIPFGVNVTTMDPGVDALRKNGVSDTEFGVRAVATQPTNGFGNGIGGVALLNSFNDTIDNPVFVFNKGARNGGMTISHEVGHALGLVHDGLNNLTYHPGVGSGPTGWGPLMGAPFGKVLTQWSRGEYVGSTSTQNDLAIITKPANGFSYRNDDFGNAISSAQELIATNGNLSEWGLIERNTDLDFFEFTTEAGEVSLDIVTFTQDSNLDILAKLYDSDGNLIAEDNPLNPRNASFVETLDAGTYFFSVEGTGRPDRYTDYGSLGYYSVTGSIVDSGVIDGDFNDDGLWDVIDVDQLVADIAGPGTPADYDLTGDGLVDIADRDAWLAEAGGINLTSGNPYLLGDLDLNGDVDGLDFIGWNNNRFMAVAAWSAGDFSADGIVDGIDFTLWNANKFTSADDAAAAAALNDASYIEPLDEAPFWPLGHDGHHHQDGHDHDGFLTDVLPENFDFSNGFANDFSSDLTVAGVNATGTVHSQVDQVRTPTRETGFSGRLPQTNRTPFETFATSRSVQQTSGRMAPSIVDQAFRLM